ncbi:DEAD/DEAH box helicase [Egibacter rhizosphaerae]|uniref:DEAD/DEAH box helicase n=1 Tax=Egibacter rhizosphaerae TaxID=1670831 RepID=A0A411YKI5_9ACTN|nr:DEAD/DEAH box helicase [Egibacter rhizosphaerae]QBI21712.1 DEAD/DEAH box helicase [Egibacter rhizosphaerae]
MSDPDRFAARYAHPLDDFQDAGITALHEGRSVLVAAPTGAGKTVVGEYGVWRALDRGRRCFYTTPIKALSNQKYGDLCREHGEGRVGLLTGDHSINGDAPVVVMTTEVLRNMLYERSRALDGLDTVVLDEVHYLADRERGAVWEETIVQLAADVQLACLSATVSNAEEFGAWLAATRDGCDVVISERRPVPLAHHYAVNDRIEPIFKAGKQGGQGRKGAKAAREAAAAEARGGVPNPDLVMLERRAQQRGRRGRGPGGGTKLLPPRRSDLVASLRERRWLPAIVFVFSRAGCDGAVGQLVGDGVRLTSKEEREEIRAIVDDRAADLERADLDVLDFGPWREALAHGIASHHAGMVPLFRETVEELFVRGLVKVCFATETLALGINMPARTVVIERLEKWDGQQHVLLSPGQFTQLTGRAGRRGLDERGHAVVLHQRDVDFTTVASLVGRRVEPLISRFQPSYNMAVNLLRRHDRAGAEQLLEASFAQWQARNRVVDDEARIERNREALEGYAENLVSDYGDFPDYWGLRRELSRLEKAGAKARREARQRAITEALADLAPGEVVRPPGRRDDTPVAVVRVIWTKSGTPLAEAVTTDRKLVRLGPRELDGPPERVGRVPLPHAGGPRQPAYRKQVANALRQVETAPRVGSPGDAGNGDTLPETDAEEAERQARIAELRESIGEHPVHHDPARSEIEVWAHRYDELERDTAKIERRVARHTHSLVDTFRRIVGVLGDHGYLDGPQEAPRPTDDGLALAALHLEADLLLAECLRAGLLTDLDPAELAAVASVFVHETRMKDPPPVASPTARVDEVLDAIDERWQRLSEHEQAAGLPVTREPDPGFVEVVHRWARGAHLDAALDGSELTPGDFVRGTKRVADLLRQLRDADTGLASPSQAAHRAIVRGVVAADL